jgi:TRAP-type uncharacterized transport system fused permease subunit
VALAGFAGAAVAGAKPMETSFQAWKFAKGLYLVPLFFVFNESIIMGGPIGTVVWDGLLAIVALTAFAACLEGHLLGPLRAWRRVLLLPAIAALYWPDWRVELVGLGLIPMLLWPQPDEARSTPPA